MWGWQLMTLEQQARITTATLEVLPDITILAELLEDSISLILSRQLHQPAVCPDTPAAAHADGTARSEGPGTGHAAVQEADAAADTGQAASENPPPQGLSLQLPDCARRLQASRMSSRCMVRGLQ